jgi:hypothetical protein
MATTMMSPPRDLGGVAQRNPRRTRAQSGEVLDRPQRHPDPRRAPTVEIPTGDPDLVAADAIPIEVTGDQGQREFDRGQSLIALIRLMLPVITPDSEWGSGTGRPSERS